MISQTKLSQDLETLGYSASIRRLTDWRQKGLLPKLKSRGRGPGRGKSFYWDDPDVLKRAFLLSQAFEHHVTADHAALLLAFAGFEIDASRIRRVWVRHLSELEKIFNGPRDVNEYADDSFWDAGVKFARQLDEIDGVDRDTMEHLIVEGFKTVYALNSFFHNPDELSLIASAINEFLLASMKQKKIGTAMTLTVRQVDRILAFLRMNFAISEIKALIKSYPIDGFRRAIQYLQKLVRIMEQFATSFVDDAEKWLTAMLIRTMFRAILGPIVLPLLLKMIYEGHEKRLAQSVNLLDQYLHELHASGIENATEMDEKIEMMKIVMPDFGRQFSTIWKNFSLFRLYHLR